MFVDADESPIDVKLSHRQPNGLVLEVTGDLDHGSVGAFLDAVTALRADGGPHLVVDLSACVFCDSAGICAMARLVRETEDHGGQMLLAGSRPSVARTLRLTGLSELIPNHPTVPAALAALPSGAT